MGKRKYTTEFKRQVVLHFLNSGYGAKKLPDCLVLTMARFVSGQNTGRAVERRVSPSPPKDIPLLSRSLCCSGCEIIIAPPAKQQQNSTLQPPVPSTDGRGFTAKGGLLSFARDDMKRYAWLNRSFIYFYPAFYFFIIMVF